MVSDEVWYTPEQVAEMMHYDVRTIRQAIREGRLEAGTFLGEYRISDTQLRNHLDKQRQLPQKRVRKRLKQIEAQLEGHGSNSS